MVTSLSESYRVNLAHLLDSPLFLLLPEKLDMLELKQESEGGGLKLGLNSSCQKTTGRGPRGNPSFTLKKKASRISNLKVNDK